MQDPSKTGKKVNSTGNSNIPIRAVTLLDFGRRDENDKAYESNPAHVGASKSESDVCSGIMLT
jgi:hypothetical protein